MDRGEAAKIGGMDRQTLRDWVHRFNATGPDGLFDNWTDGPTPRLSPGGRLARPRSSPGPLAHQPVLLADAGFVLS